MRRPFLAATRGLPLVLLLLHGTPARAQNFTITSVAGDGIQGYFGDNGPALKAELWAFSGVAVDNFGNIFIADTGNCRIRKVSNGVITTVAGNGTCDYGGDNGPATRALLNYPRGAAVDPAGNIYIADAGNSRIRKVDTAGVITTIAGDGHSGFLGDGGPATAAELADAWSVAVDSAGNVYFVDRTNQRIRKIDLKGIITTFAGNGSNVYSGDGGQAMAAGLQVPVGVTLDSNNNIYIVESGSCVIRKVDASGIIHTVAGSGTFGYFGDGGPATKALLNDPQGAAVDAAGNIFIADEDNQRVREVTPDGTINTIAGNGQPNFGGDGGPSTGSLVDLPEGVAVGPGGIVYFVDSGNKRVRALTPPPAVFSGGVITTGDFGAFPSVAPGSWISVYGSGFTSVSRPWATADFSGINAPTALSGVSLTIGGAPAFIGYISPGLINAQVPTGIGTGPQDLVVTGPGGMSPAYSVNVNAVEPGLLSPPSFNLVGIQYAEAQFTDGVTFVLPPGAIPGYPSRRAKPQDVITFYGVGFGSVTPDSPAGQIVAGKNTLNLPLEIRFGQTAANIVYQGLTPGIIGLYQFNVTVPDIPTSDAVPVTFTLGGAAVPQTLYIAIQNN